MNAVDWLIYINPKASKAYYFNPMEFYRAAVQGLKLKPPSFLAENEGLRPYECIGFLLPFQNVKDIAAYKFDLKTGEMIT